MVIISSNSSECFNEKWLSTRVSWLDLKLHFPHWYWVLKWWMVLEWFSTFSFLLLLITISSDVPREVPAILCNELLYLVTPSQYRELLFYCLQISLSSRNHGYFPSPGLFVNFSNIDDMFGNPLMNFVIPLMSKLSLQGFSFWHFSSMLVVAISNIA